MSASSDDIINKFKNMVEKILKELGFADTSIKIYTQLLENGQCSARQLAENSNMPRATVYDQLKILINSGLIIEKEEGTKKLFVADDIKNLQNLLKSKVENLKKDENLIKELIPSLNLKTKTLEPKIKFYSGVEGVKQVLKDLMWSENIETYTMWPISEMVKILGKEYFENLNRRRIRQKISIKGIWPRDKKVDFKNYPFLGVGGGYLRELRLAPVGMTWPMGYWMYGDKVAFVSSKKECFGFVINSSDFASLIKTQFDQIWKISTPIKAEPQYTDEFLKTI